MPPRSSRPGASRRLAVVATVDTGWLIAAERNPRAAMLHLAAMTRASQVLAVTPVVVVEALQRAHELTRVEFFLARLHKEPILPEDGRRAAELLRQAGRNAGSSRMEQSRRVHAIGTADALVAAVAERLHGIVYTDDPKHMEWLREAGARIVVQPVPF